MNNKQAVLVILDGWGHREDSNHNAVHAANTPTFDMLWSQYPHTLLEASEEAVGLPIGQPGNSEIGHGTIGAGRSLDTDLVRIKKSINEGDFHNNPVLIDACDYTVRNNSCLHLMGLYSDGGVHSHKDHMIEIVKLAIEKGVKSVKIHLFTDGRDTPPQSAHAHIIELEEILTKIPEASIASLSGRYFAMDRDNNWDRLEKFEHIIWKHQTKNIETYSGSASDYVKDMYNQETFDEHILPKKLREDAFIDHNDAVIIYNFRADRARMLTERLLSQKEHHNLCIATLTQYKDSYDVNVIFTPRAIEATLASVISEANLTQSHIAETEKFPHATYFLNGGKDNPHHLESHILLDSRKDVRTHDEAPEMRAMDIADTTVEEINKGINFIFVNIANPDIVGHTGNVPAIIKALETTDAALSKIYEACKEAGATLMVTADHGNAEYNFDESINSAHTAHTTNLVPCIITKDNVSLSKGGTLADLAPTVFDILGISKHETMTGVSLIK